MDGVIKEGEGNSNKAYFREGYAVVRRESAGDTPVQVLGLAGRNDKTGEEFVRVIDQLQEGEQKESIIPKKEIFFPEQKLFESDERFGNLVKDPNPDTQKSLRADFKKLSNPEISAEDAIDIAERMGLSDKQVKDFIRSLHHRNEDEIMARLTGHEEWKSLAKDDEADVEVKTEPLSDEEADRRTEEIIKIYPEDESKYRALNNASKAFRAGNMDAKTFAQNLKDLGLTTEEEVKMALKLYQFDDKTIKDVMDGGGQWEKLEEIDKSKLSPEARQKIEQGENKIEEVKEIIDRAGKEGGISDEDKAKAEQAIELKRQLENMDEEGKHYGRKIAGVLGILILYALLGITAKSFSGLAGAAKK